MPRHGSALGVALVVSFLVGAMGASTYLSGLPSEAADKNRIVATWQFPAQNLASNFHPAARISARHHHSVGVYVRDLGFALSRDPCRRWEKAA